MTAPTSQWIREHYYQPSEKRGVVQGRYLLVCRRCDQPVGYLTKHARLRHGDDVAIGPNLNPDPFIRTVW